MLDTFIANAIIIISEKTKQNKKNKFKRRKGLTMR
jgi:hypothetical protein